MDVAYKARTLPYGYLLVLLNRTGGGAVLEAATDVVEHHLHNIVLSTFLLALLFAYLVYYLSAVVHMPRVVGGSAALVELVSAACPVVRRRYWPLLWAPQTHLQTFLRVALQSYPVVERRRELLLLSDGGQLYLDWCNDGYDERTQTVSDPERPTVIILPGITGSFDENYIHHFVQDAQLAGHRAVVFNYRGLGGAMLRTPMLDCLGNPQNIKEAIDHVAMQRHASRIVLLGVSMGGIQIISYLAMCGRTGANPKVKSAIVISVPWQLDVAYQQLQQNLVNRYTINYYISNKIRNLLTRNKEIFRKAEEDGVGVLNFEKALKIQDFNDVVTHVTCPMFGFKDRHDFVRYASPHTMLPSVRVPLFCLNSIDDVYCPKQAIPERIVRQNPAVVMVTTKRGGHIGFMEGVWPFHKTWMDRFIVQLLNIQGDVPDAPHKHCS